MTYALVNNFSYFLTNINNKIIKLLIYIYIYNINRHCIYKLHCIALYVLDGVLFYHIPVNIMKSCL